MPNNSVVFRPHPSTPKEKNLREKKELNYDLIKWNVNSNLKTKGVGICCTVTQHSFWIWNSPAAVPPLLKYSLASGLFSLNSCWSYKGFFHLLPGWEWYGFPTHLGFRGLLFILSSPCFSRLLQKENWSLWL